jgi:hypothetical protein
MRPGGYGLLLAGGTVDELIHNEIGNEVLLVKYVESPSTTHCTSRMATEFDSRSGHTWIAHRNATQDRKPDG